VSAALHRAAALAARRPALVLALAAVLATAGLALALRLKPDAGVDTLVGRDSPAYAATETLRERFGDDAIIVLVRGDLRKLLLSQDLERLLGLEGCIAGNVPRGAAPAGGARGPCAALARTRSVEVVLGPGTFINTAVLELRAGYARRVAGAAARADAAASVARAAARRQGLGRDASDRRAARARREVQSALVEQLATLAERYGLVSIPRLDDRAFVSTLVFDATKAPGTPKRRFAYLFPSRGARPGRTALVQVRLKAGLGERERSAAIEQVRAAVAMAAWKPRNGATYTVTGAPVVVSDLTASISGSMRVLLLAALLVMAAMLALAFRRRPRLLPLAIALAAAALTFGALSLVGASLTMASIAVLPVLIGLAVDYAIQLQSRIAEERGEHGSAGAAVRRAALLGAPAVAVAAAATAAGFAVLAFSPVPMVRGFGILLVAGIAFAFALALLAGSAALVLADRAAPPAGLQRLAARVPRRPPRAGAPSDAALLAAAARAALRRAAAAALAAVHRAATTARAALRRAATTALGYAVRRPARVLAIALAVAACGWVLDTQTRVESDIQRLVPQDMPALRDLDALQRSTGVGGEVDVVVEGADVTSPAVIDWMIGYQAAVLREQGFNATRGCGEARLCPAFSLPDLFTTAASRRDAGAVDALLDAVPPYFSRSVISADRRTATLAFGVRLMALDRQKHVLDAMRARLDRDRPPGVRAALAGLPVLAADANAEIASRSRRVLTLLAGLLAVALVLLAAFRDVGRALVPIVPIALATGWSALVLFAVRVPLNPMSVTLGALVIAISTEFSVLLAERYREERGRGHEPRAALRRTYASTGAAVLASGATAIAGFAVLVVSDIRMLRDFGFVTVVDLTVSLLGVLFVLPAVLLLAERRVPTSRVDS
jgi:hydrophobe/amphiphile efflux-3 (HAE3) family protein